MSILDFPEDDDVENAQDLIVKKPVIEFRHVDFNYAESNELFKNLDINIAAGEKVGLVGHSSPGKSSFVNLMLRYFKPCAGHIFIDGHDTAFVTKDSLRQNLAVIPPKKKRATGAQKRSAKTTRNGDSCWRVWQKLCLIMRLFHPMRCTGLAKQEKNHDFGAFLLLIKVSITLHWFRTRSYDSIRTARNNRRSKKALFL